MVLVIIDDLESVPLLLKTGCTYFFEANATIHQPARPYTSFNSSNVKLSGRSYTEAESNAFSKLHCFL